MKLPDYLMGKVLGLYMLLVYLFAYLVVIVIVKVATGVNIDDRQVECSAQPWARTAVILSITVIAALIHAVISYYYVNRLVKGLMALCGNLEAARSQSGHGSSHTSPTPRCLRSRYRQQSF